MGWGMYGYSLKNTSHSPELPSPTEKPQKVSNWNTGSGNNVLFPGSITVGDKRVYGVSDQLYAFDKRTGEEVWRFDTRGRTKATPALADETIYVPVPANGNVFAVDAETGQRQWNQVVDGLENESSLAVKDGTVYALAQTTYGCHPCRQKATIAALKGQDGTIKWSTTVNENDHDIPQRAPAVANGKIYVTVESGALYVFDIETGEKIRHLLIGGNTEAPPVIANEKILVTSGPRILALDLETYEELWRFKTTGVISTPPTVRDGIAYVTSKDGNLYAVDLETGQRNWSVPVTTNQYGLRYQKPCTVGDIVVVGNRKIPGFNTDDGSEAWATEVLVDESSLQLSRIVPGENRLYWSKGILTTNPQTPTPTQTTKPTSTSVETTEVKEPDPTSSSAPGFGTTLGVLGFGGVAGYLGLRAKRERTE